MSRDGHEWCKEKGMPREALVEVRAGGDICCRYARVMGAVRN